MNLILHVTLIA